MSEKKFSFYTVLVALVFITVSAIMSLHLLYIYNAKKENLIERMQKNSTLSMSTLQKNLASAMEAYAIHEYEKMLLTEIELRHHYAIVLEDYNMGKIVGKNAFVTGFITKSDGSIASFNSYDTIYSNKLDECYFKQSETIFSLSEKEKILGKIDIFISNKDMKNELQALIKKTLIDTLFISLLLIISLILVIKHFMLKPISEVITLLDDGDKDGLPKNYLEINGYKEVSTLSEKLNNMIKLVRDSKKELEKEHQKLLKTVAINRSIMEAIPDLIWLKDEKGCYIMCNKNFEKLYGVSTQELIGRDDYAFVAQETADFFRENDNKAIKEGKAVVNEEWVTFATDGKKVLLETTKTPLIGNDEKVIGVVGMAHDITHYRELINELEYIAKYDNLTAIPNRYLFLELMKQAMNSCLRKNTKIALLYIDLDGFKEINDTYGHEFGDAVLQQMASRIKASFRIDDIVARLGGDEFVVGISEFMFEKDISILIEKLLLKLQEPVFYHDKILHVTASIGVSIYPQSNPIDILELLRQADEAMYSSKREGKNRYTFSKIR